LSFITQVQISNSKKCFNKGEKSKIFHNEIKIKNRMKIIPGKNKIKFSAKEIFIIAIIVIAVLALSYDGDTKDVDNFRLGFPIDSLK
jgi:hypothetical protein